MTAPLDAPADPALANLALDDFDVSDPKLYQDDVWQPYFARLRREDPVHYCRQSLYGPYWSVTKYKDIMQVEVNHQVYSSASELGGIAVEDQPKDMDRPSFIRMDPPSMTSSAWSSVRSSRRATSPTWKASSASAPRACSTACRAAGRSIGSTG